MTSFRKLWNTFVDSLKPQILREHHQPGPYAIIVDSRPFTVSKGR
jgi:hypothetical protein